MIEQAKKWFKNKKRYNKIYYSPSKDLYIKEEVLDHFKGLDIFLFEKIRIDKNVYEYKVTELNVKEEPKKIDEVKKILKNVIFDNSFELEEKKQEPKKQVSNKKKSKKLNKK